jgi:nicotinate-nucleotide adenylyltransferase
MARLAAADNPAFEVDPAEVEAAQASYTILSLERLRAELGPRQPLVLLLGVDAFLGLPTWRRWTELFDFAHLAVANRPGYSLGGAAMPAALAEQVSRRQAAPDTLGAAPAGRLVQFAMTPLAISATDIRARCAAGQSLRYLLPPPVVDYISRHQLYL